MRILVGSADFHREAIAFWLDRQLERTYTSLISPQSFRRASRRQFVLVGSHDPEEFQAALLDLNRFTALDTPRTLRISRNLTPQEPNHVHVRLLSMHEMRGPNLAGRPGRSGNEFVPQSSEAAFGTRGLSVLPDGIRAPELLHNRECCATCLACMNRGCRENWTGVPETRKVTADFILRSV